MQSLTLAISRHRAPAGIGSAIACILLATALATTTCLIDIRPVPRWTDMGNDAGADISLPLLAIVIGGGALVVCTRAVVIALHRAWVIVASIAYFLALIAAVIWLCLSILGDVWGMLLPTAYYSSVPTHPLNDAIQLPLQIGALMLLLLAAVEMGYLMQSAWRRKPIAGERHLAG